MNHIESFEALLFKVELLTYCHAQIRLNIIRGKAYSLKAIFDDFRAFKRIKERDYPYKKLVNTLSAYESSLGIERPKLDSLYLRDQ